MPRRFQRNSKLVVRSNKEVIDSVNFAVAAGTSITVVLAVAVNDYVGTVGTCPLSSKIKALWIETSYTKADSLVGRMDWLVAKKPANTTFAGLVPGATGGSNLRKFIFLERKGIMSNDGLVAQGGSPKFSAGWLRIPKRYQNMGEDDEIILRFNSSVVYNICIKIIYKWYA